MISATGITSSIIPADWPVNGTFSSSPSADCYATCISARLTCLSRGSSRCPVGPSRKLVYDALPDQVPSATLHTARTPRRRGPHKLLTA